MFGLKRSASQDFLMVFADHISSQLSFNMRCLKNQREVKDELAKRAKDIEVLSRNLVDVIDILTREGLTRDKVTMIKTNEGTADAKSITEDAPSELSIRLRIIENELKELTQKKGKKHAE